MLHDSKKLIGIKRLSIERAAHCANASEMEFHFTLIHKIRSAPIALGVNTKGEEENGRKKLHIRGVSYILSEISLNRALAPFHYSSGLKPVLYSRMLLIPPPPR